jgi:hypothetical protein
MHKSCISSHKHHSDRATYPTHRGKKLQFNNFWDHKNVLPVNFLNCGNKVLGVPVVHMRGGYATRDGTLESPSLVLISCSVLPISLDPHMHVTLEMILNNLSIHGPKYFWSDAHAHTRAHTHQQQNQQRHDVQISKHHILLSCRRHLNHYRHLILATKGLIRIM